jgi:hypothetical protein
MADPALSSAIGVLQTLERTFGPVHHVELHAVQQRRGLQGDFGEAFGDHQHFGVRIFDDVLHLARRELGGDAGKPQPRPLRRPQKLVIARPVIDEESHPVSGVKVQGPEQVGALVGAGVELAIGHRLSRGGHDIGGLVGMGFGVVEGVHVKSLDRTSQEF